MSIITRFAPSPTGLLHLGHAASALIGWRRARAGGGRFLLRLEDIDPTRCRPEFATAILRDLAWLGIDWDEEVRVQSAHLPDYAAVLGELRGRGLLYPCFCTRAEISREVAASIAAPHGPDGAPIYPGICKGLSDSERVRRIAAGAPHAWRLDMARAVGEVGPLHWHEEEVGDVPANPSAFGDVVLARREVSASYHLCVSHDDALQGVSLVTRGEDLRAATSVHRLLQALMNWPTPTYAHHPLLRDAQGRRLAKRDGVRSIADLHAAGLSPAYVRALAEDGA